MRVNIFSSIVALSILVSACGETPSPEQQNTAGSVAEDKTTFEILGGMLRPATQVVGQPDQLLAMDARLAHYNTPALSVAVAENGAESWSHCYGDCKTDIFIFQAASLSKAVAATGIVTYALNEGIDLDADISSMVTSVNLTELNPSGMPITLRALLSHTNGAAVSGFPGYGSGETVPSNADLIRGENANTATVMFNPDIAGNFRYSGGGYQVAQLFIEDHSGRNFADLMAELVLIPVGMTNSSFSQPPSEALMAHGALARAHEGSGEEVAGGWHVYPEQAAAGLWTTPSDYLKFGLALMKSYEGNSDFGVSVAVAKEVLKPVDNEYGLGMGFAERDGKLRIGHSGSNKGFRCFFEGYVREGEGVVVMTNATQGGALAQEYLRGVNTHYGWADPRIKEIDLVPLTDQQLGAFTGSYLAGEGQPALFDVRIEDEGLRGVQTNGNTFKLLPIGETRFVDPDDGTEVEFVMTETGLVAETGGRLFPKAKSE